MCIHQQNDLQRSLLISCARLFIGSGDLPGGFVAEQKAETVPFGPTSSPPTCTDSRLQCQLLLGQNKNSETTLLCSSEFMYVCVRKGDQRVRAYI